VKKGIHNLNRKIAIFGAGGFAREVMVLLHDANVAKSAVAFYEDDDIWSDRTMCSLPVLPLSRFDSAKVDLILAVGSPALKSRIRNMLPADTRYPTLIHPTALRSKSVEIGQGCIIAAGSILTCDIKLGAHVNIDRATNVGHDSVLGDYVTTAPAVTISGNCRIGSRSYLGTHACMREKTTIADDITVGMGAVVVSSLLQPGVYFGNPAKLHKASSR